MIVNASNYKTASIDDYVNGFRKIYKKYLDTSGKTARSVVDIWLHVVDHASRVGEAVRKRVYADVLTELAEVAVWVMNFVAKCNNLRRDGPDGIFHFATPLSDIIWNKYPGICQYCLQEQCICLVNSKEREERTQRWNSRRRKDCPDQGASEKVEESKEDRKRMRRERADSTRPQKKTTLQQLEEMFDEIYTFNIFHFSMDVIAFHLLEEVGEVARALTDVYTRKKSEQPGEGSVQKKLSEVEEELADVMSWTYTLILKLQEEFKEVKYAAAARESAAEIGLMDAIWSSYGGAKMHCRICCSSSCRCGTWFVAQAGFTMPGLKDAKTE